MCTKTAPYYTRLLAHSAIHVAPSVHASYSWDNLVDYNEGSVSEGRIPTVRLFLCKHATLSRPTPASW